MTDRVNPKARRGLKQVHRIVVAFQTHMVHDSRIKVLDLELDLSFSGSIGFEIPGECFHAEPPLRVRSQESGSGVFGILTPGFVQPVENVE